MNFKLDHINENNSSWSDTDITDKLTISTVEQNAYSSRAQIFTDIDNTSYILDKNAIQTFKLKDGKYELQKLAALVNSGSIIQNATMLSFKAIIFVHPENTNKILIYPIGSEKPVELYEHDKEIIGMSSTDFVLLNEAFYLIIFNWRHTFFSITLTHKDWRMTQMPKFYNKATEFTGLSVALNSYLTCGSSFVCVDSKSWLRFFSKVFSKSAKVTLKSIESGSIKSIATPKSQLEADKWVLCNYRGFLVLIKTFYKHDTAYNKSIKAQLSKYKRLEVTPKDIEDIQDSDFSFSNQENKFEFNAVKFNYHSGSQLRCGGCIGNKIFVWEIISNRSTKNSTKYNVYELKSTVVDFEFSKDTEKPEKIIALTSLSVEVISV